MTLIATFTGVDCKYPTPKPASIYILSDSRISWGDKAVFDCGRKVFGCKNYPDIFGYCGDALFPLIVLSQIVDLADHGMVFERDWTCQQKFQAVIDRLIAAFNKFPHQVEGITTGTLEIIHASRDENQNFFCRKMKWTKSTKQWRAEDGVLGDHSDKLLVSGSGKREFIAKFESYAESANQKTSRAVFQCFTDTLKNINDKYCGGPPQLVGLYRKFNARFFGIIYERNRYFYGMQINNALNFNNIEWRNEFFEVCDGETMKIKEGAKVQPNVVMHPRSNSPGPPKQ